jgi:hypothetical protein
VVRQRHFFFALDLPRLRRGFFSPSSSSGSGSAASSSASGSSSSSSASGSSSSLFGFELLHFLFGLGLLLFLFGLGLLSFFRRLAPSVLLVDRLQDQAAISVELLGVLAQQHFAPLPHLLAAKDAQIAVRRCHGPRLGPTLDDRQHYPFLLLSGGYTYPSPASENQPGLEAAAP